VKAWTARRGQRHVHQIRRRKTLRTSSCCIRSISSLKLIPPVDKLVVHLLRRARLVRELRMALAMVVSARSPVISIRHAAAATSPIGSSRPGQRPRLGAARTAVAAALLLYLGEEA
jgi:hypothetical protein